MIEDNKYITSTIINGQKVIPSDTFRLGGDEYILLEILSSDNEIYLKVMGVDGVNMGNIYIFPKIEFENKNMSEIKESLNDYKY